MKCEELQERLADEGPQGLREDAGAQRHLEECAACFAVMEELARLDAVLPQVPEADAPGAVVEALLQRAAQEPAKSVAPSAWWLRPAAVAATVVLAVSSATFVLRRQASPPMLDRAPDAPQPRPAQAPLDKEQRDRLRALGYFTDDDGAARSNEVARLQELEQQLKALEEAKGKAAANAEEVAKVREAAEAAEDRLKDEASKRDHAEADYRSANGGLVGFAPAATPAPGRADDKPRSELSVREEVPETIRPEKAGEKTADVGNVVRGNEEAEANIPDFATLVNGIPPINTVSNPKLRRRVEIAWPASARARAGEVVTLKFGLYPDGRVTGPTVTQSVSPEIDAAVQAAVRQWVYEPMGEAVVTLRIVVPGPSPSASTKTAGVQDGVPGGVAGGHLGGLPDILPAPEPVRVGGQIKEPPRTRYVAPVMPANARAHRIQGIVILEIAINTVGKVTEVRVLRGNPFLNDAAIAAVRQWEYAPTLLNGTPVPVFMTVTVNFKLDDSPAPSPSPVRPSSTDPAAVFFAQRAAVEGVAFQPARGYWANTYLPGDPALRLLQARLRGAIGLPALHEAAAPAPQPFDPPAHGALSVQLQADRRGLAGPSRMLLQVGLKATPRAAGRRAPTTLALVLDLRGPLSAEEAASLRALALAFAEAREVGDRFHLVFAGRAEPTVAPAAFKHGPLAVTLDRALQPGAPEGGHSLADAVAEALRLACPGAEPDAPLGAAAVLIATGQPLAEAATLAGLAHQGALAGIATSVVGVGHAVVPEQLDQVALAGQGCRRLLEAPAQARNLAESQLAAAQNVVARAVRLRIRLAEGVRLVGVIGSRRLEEEAAERVREAERSIDLRLAQVLGLEADRGEDEDGLQIVIPAFQAGDDHVVLLDVVAERPGAVADVSVRYKDLVALANGTARAGLWLPRGEAAPGPREHNVLQNLLVHEVATRLDVAGRALARGDASAARAAIEGTQALLRGVEGQEPALGRVLAADRALLSAYAEALRTSPTPLLADSLRYAALRRLQPAPSPLVL